MPTSATYNFAEQFTVDEIVKDAFWRLGIHPERLVPLDIDTGMTSANLELRGWSASKQILGLIQREMLQLVPNQAFYVLPNYVNRVFEVTKANYQSITTWGGNSVVGIGSTDSPLPNYGLLFQPNNSTPVTQNQPNGFMGGLYAADSKGALPSIWYVGVQSAVDAVYTLDFLAQYTAGSADISVRSPQQIFYPAFKTQWFVIEAPPTAAVWSIRETAGATLNLTQLIFGAPNPNLRDIEIDDMGSDDYMGLTQKFNAQAQPSAYYFNQKKQKSIYLYGNNYTGFSSLIYSADCYAQDINALVQNADIVSKLYDPLICGMALRLAPKYNPQMYPILKDEYARLVDAAIQSDRENVDVRMEYDMSTYWNI